MIFILLITYFLSESTKSIWLALHNVLILSLFSISELNLLDTATGTIKCFLILLVGK